MRAAPPTSARITSSRSIRSRPTRSRSCAGRRRCATARPRSAASSAPPTTGFRTRCRPAVPSRSRVMVCRSRRRSRPPRHRPASPPRHARAFSSVDRGVESGVLLDTGAGNFAFHADVYGRNTADYSIPSYPYLPDQTRPSPTGASPTRRRARTAPRSAAPTSSRAAISARRSRRTTRSTISPASTAPTTDTRIDAHQTKINVKGEYRPDAAAIDAVRFWAGATDYRAQRDRACRSRRSQHRRRATDLHQQGAGDPHRGAADAVQRALRRGDDGAGLSGRPSGIDRAEPGQSGHAVQRPVGPQQQHPRCRLRLQRVQVHGRDRGQIAGRIEHVELHGTTPNFPADFLPDGTPQVGIARNPSFTPKSGSIGLLQDLPGGMVGSITGAICRARAEAGRTVLARRA